MTLHASNWNRRRLLTVPLVAAAAAGLAATQAAAPAAAGHHGPALPDVPGMLGDRLANEFWYQFDEASLYNRTQETKDAFNAIEQYVVGGGEWGFVDRWLQFYAEPGYPGSFTEYVTPIREPLAVLSRVELEVFDRYYRRHDPRLVSAFADFAQGVLYDPRRGVVHTMDGYDPVGYPGYRVWHVFQRSMMFLGIDTDRWRVLNPINGFAWAVQSLAKPSMEHVNPPLPRATVARLAARWLPLSPRRLDEEFQSAPYPAG
ncbi:hypothetical protein KZZ52_32435 [Dactylosporangium sp. AC04546]|uniref:hypothetical protein n=1 Tax=Dactylosporangium sp. AC04546 TaxID=2862460 RepID=UPI001EDE2C1E|nr:hypothetical protein [Dactylosporangium sp. AC04546]WVK78700.1 hypothetical protein KZZ52_32435 [Dactylosporangium sp. AC04546]